MGDTSDKHHQNNCDICNDNAETIIECVLLDRSSTAVMIDECAAPSSTLQTPNWGQAKARIEDNGDAPRSSSTPNDALLLGTTMDDRVAGDGGGGGPAKKTSSARLLVVAKDSSICRICHNNNQIERYGYQSSFLSSIFFTFLSMLCCRGLSSLAKLSGVFCVSLCLCGHHPR